MTRHDFSLDTELRAPRKPRARLRWLLRLSVLACITLILAVTLSQPRVSAQMQALADQLAARLSGPEQPAETAPERTVTTTWTGQRKDRKPTVSILPESRLPVRRAASASWGE